MLKPCALAVLLLAMCPIYASADEVSTFAGTITQAPAGNIFGVALDDFAEGNIDYPFVLGSNFNGSVNNFTIVFDIGNAIYTDVVTPTGNKGSVTISDNLVIAIEVLWPASPCIPGHPLILCPPLAAFRDTFFTTPEDCQPDQVCGTLDFTGSEPHVAPEPPTILLLVIGFVGMIFPRLRLERPTLPARSAFIASS